MENSFKKTYFINCPFCSYNDQKSHVLKHLQNKKKCNPEIELIKYEQAYKEISEKKKHRTKKYIDNENLDHYICKYCEKNIKNKYYLNYHIKYKCKSAIIKQDLETIELLKEELISVKQDNDQLNTYIKTISETLDVIAKKDLNSSETHSSSHNSTMSHNDNSNLNSGTINNGVIINNYHDSKDYDFISDKIILKLIGEFRHKFLEELMRLNHFNPQLPNLQNIRLSPSDYKAGLIQIFENDMWKKVRIETIIPEKTDFLVLRSINAIDAMKDPDSNLDPDLQPNEKKTIEKVETFLNTVDINGDNFDKKNYSNLVTDMSLTVLNNS